MKQSPRAAAPRSFSSSLPLDVPPLTSNAPLLKMHTMNSNIPTDMELVERYLGGDSEAFEQILKRYEQKIFNFGLRMCRHQQDAEDLLQETFLNVLRYLDRFRGESAFKNWLYKIASSVCIKKRRKTKHQPDRELSWEELLPEDHVHPDNTPQWLTTPIDQLLNRELAQVIESAIGELPPKYRIVWVLRDKEQFNTQETAEMLSLSQATVKVRLHRARLFLRNQIRDHYEGLGYES